MKTIRFGWLMAGLWVIAATQSFAQTITVTQWDVNQAQEGVNIQAEYDLGALPCCEAENVRWIQRILLLNPDGTPKTNVPGYINIPDFIDPQINQPGGPWDGVPWYDVTYNSAADRTNNVNMQGGKGAYFNDSPGGWYGNWGPMSFLAYTALVCLDPNGTDPFEVEYLGGFSWGFSVAANGTITGMGPQAMAFAQPTVDMFNTSLGLGDFAVGYHLKLGDEHCEMNFVSAVPEPFTMGLSLAAGGLAIRRIRARRKAA